MGGEAAADGSETTPPGVDVSESREGDTCTTRQSQYDDSNENDANLEVVLRVELRVVFTENQLPESKLALHGTVPGVGNVSNASPTSLPEDLDAERRTTLAVQTIVKANAALLRSLASDPTTPSSSSKKKGTAVTAPSTTTGEDKLGFSVLVSRESVAIGDFLHKDTLNLNDSFMRILLGETHIVMPLDGGLPNALPDASSVELSVTLSRPLLSPTLCREMLPVVISLHRVERLPDQPATMQQLDKRCHPVRVKYALTKEMVGDADAAPEVERCYTAASVTEWRRVRNQEEPIIGEGEEDEAKKSELERDRQQQQQQNIATVSMAKGHATSGATSMAATSLKPSSTKLRKKSEDEPEPLLLPLNVRDVDVNRSELFLFGGVPEHSRVELFSRMKLTASVYDRTALPSDSELKSTPISAPVDVVYASAGGALLKPLASGARRFDIELPLHAMTNVAGGGDLEWKTRPGRYTEAGTAVIMEVVALHSVVVTTTTPPSAAAPSLASKTMVGSSNVRGPSPVTRAIFILHYNDTVLLHRLQAVLRMTNAASLKLEGSNDHVLRTLKTYKLAASQLEDMSLDIVTGFQLIDSVRRLILLEGLANGDAMRQVREIAVRSLASSNHDAGSYAQRSGISRDESGGDEQQQRHTSDETAESTDLSGDGFERCVHERKILFNLDIRYPYRLYGSMMGADLWPLKLRSKLTRICKDPVLCGKRVRPSCVEGIRRLSNLPLCTLLRDVDRMDLWPTEAMLKVVDKKFGGEMTKSDLGEVDTNTAKSVRASETMDEILKSFGSIVLESERMLHGEHEANHDNADGMALHTDGEIPEMIENETSRRDAWRQARQERFLETPTTLRKLMENPDYLAKKAEKDRARSRRNLHTENRDFIESLKPRAKTIRDSWQQWNPERVVQKDDEHEGNIPEEAGLGPGSTFTGDTATAFEICGGSKDVGSGMHKEPFRWPPVLSSSDNARHPKRPTDARIEELRSSWVENEYNNVDYGGSSRGERGTKANIAVPFHTNLVKGSGQLFEKDARYFTSVHLCGDGLIREQMEARQREEEEFNSKIVVDDIHFKSVIMSRAMPSQTDRNRSMLMDSPVKRGLKPPKRLEPNPISMRISLPHEEADKTILERKDDRSKFKGQNKEDFRRHIRFNQSAVHKRR